MNGANGHGDGATSSEMRKIGRKERRKKEGRKETEEEGVGVWKFAWGGAARDRPHACMAHFPRALSPLYFLSPHPPSHLHLHFLFLDIVIYFIIIVIYCYCFFQTHPAPKPDFACMRIMDCYYYHHSHAIISSLIGLVKCKDFSLISS